MWNDGGRPELRHQADRHEWYVVQQLFDRWKRCRLKHGKPASGEIVGSAKIILKGKPV